MLYRALNTQNPEKFKIETVAIIYLALAALFYKCSYTTALLALGVSLVMDVNYYVQQQREKTTDPVLSVADAATDTDIADYRQEPAAAAEAAAEQSTEKPIAPERVMSLLEAIVGADTSTLGSREK